MLAVAAIHRVGTTAADNQPDFAITLAHDERHLRRRVLKLKDGEKALLDLESATVLNPGDVLVLEDDRTVLISAAAEALYEVRGQSPRHLVELAWHIGNRHLPAAIEDGRITILRDHVIKSMLQGLGATVSEVDGAFSPSRGAYDSKTHAAHHHDHNHHGTAADGQHAVAPASPQAAREGAEVEQ